MTDTIRIIEALAWPVTILVLVFCFRRMIRTVLDIVTDRLRSSRQMRAKMAGVEVSFDVMEDLKERVEKIANEPDAKKRLEIAQAPLLVDDTIRKLTPSQLDVLERSYRNRLENSFLINWYDVLDEDRKALPELEKQGLVRGIELHGDSLYWFTPLGLTLLETVNGGGKRLENDGQNKSS